jgi:hypothetical protein
MRFQTVLPTLLANLAVLTFLLSPDFDIDFRRLIHVGIRVLSIFRW